MRPTFAAPREALRRRDAVRPAEIAASARRRVVVAEVAAQRDAPAAGLVRVLDDGTQAARVLAAQHLEAAPQALDPLDQRVERPRRVDAVAVHPLADAALDERRDDRARRALRDARGQGELFNIRVALLTRVRRERAAEATEERGREAGEREEVLLDLEVALVEEEDAARRVPIATGPAGLLEIALERRGRLVVDDVADVRLVDAETDGARRDHDDLLSLLHEAGLVLGAVLVGHLPVVAGARDLDEAEREPDVLDRLRGGAVDDPRARQPAAELRELADLLVAARVPHREHEIVAVRRGDDDLRIPEAEVADDVVAHRRRRRGGEREDVTRLEAGQSLAEREVRRTEVVTPLGHAVRLVDRDEPGRLLL